MVNDDQNPAHDCDLGINRQIMRCDFLNGVAPTLGTSLVPDEAPEDEGGLQIPGRPPEGSGCTNTVEPYVYNNRLQPVMIELGNTSNAAADYCLVYNYYPYVGNPGSCAVPAQGGYNGGNVIGFFYEDNVNSSLSHTEAYTYNTLNRLTQAVATGNSTYNLTFSYDRYGNMTCQINGSTQGLCPQYSFNPANNHITNSGFTYDAAGDLTADGTYTYRYDAEQRTQQDSEVGP